MLWFVVLVLMFVWVLAVATGHMMAGYIHVVYVLAMLVAIARVIMKRHVL
jgi:hypothetical protein